MKKYLFVALYFFSVNAVAQTEAEIRKHYADVNEQIAASVKLGMEGPLYNNEWVANRFLRSWPAVGIYQETTDFWYDDSPDHISTTERNPKTVLLKVTIMQKASDRRFNEEYLYRNGKLLFYFFQEGEETAVSETRLYFNNKGVLFKSSVKANGKELTTKELATEQYKDLKPNPLLIRTQAAKLQDLFVKSMM